MEFLFIIFLTAFVWLLHKFAAWLQARKVIWDAIEPLGGEKWYPIIGTCLDIIRTPEEGFYEIYEERNKKYGPTFRTWMGFTPAVHISKPEHVEKVLNNTKNLSKGDFYRFMVPWLGEGLVSVSNHKKWYHHRKVITPTFHFSILDNMVDVMTEKSQILADNLMAKADGKFFDLFPFLTLCALDIICGNELHTSVRLVLQNIFYSVAYYSLNAWCAYLILTDKRKVVTTINMTVLVVNVSCISFFWTNALLNQSKFKKLLQNIINFDENLHKRNIHVDYRTTSKKNFRRVLGRILFLVIFLVYIASSDRICGPLKQHRVLTSLSLFKGVVTSLACHQTAELVMLLKMRFSILNSHINSLAKGVPSREKHLLPLAHICSLHHDLSRTIKLFNETLGVPLLAMFTTSFVVMVLSLFFATADLQLDPVKWANVAYIAALCTVFTVDSVYICHVCYFTIKEAHRSGQLIHRIETEDHDTIDEIEMFSLQIVNENVEFTAAGFFPINYTLVFSIIVGVTTYIIILLQLSATFNDNREK